MHHWLWVCDRSNIKYGDYIRLMGLSWGYINIYDILYDKFWWDDTILVWYSFNDTLNLQVIVSPSNLHRLNIVESPRFMVKFDGLSAVYRFNDIPSEIHKTPRSNIIEAPIVSFQLNLWIALMNEPQPRPGQWPPPPRGGSHQWWRRW